MNELPQFKRKSRYAKTHVPYVKAMDFIKRNVDITFTIEEFRKFLEDGNIPSIEYGGYRIISKDHLMEYCAKSKTGERNMTNIREKEKLFFSLSTKNNKKMRRYGIKIKKHP